MSAIAKDIEKIADLWSKDIQRRQPTVAPPTLLDAAKVVVALSGWQETRPWVDQTSTTKRFREVRGERVFVTSALAIEVLREAIRREENPTFTLAPEPLPSGL